MLRFRLGLARYHYVAIHIPGKLLVIVDTLSRAPLSVSLEQEDLQAEVSTFIDNVISHLPATNKRQDEYREAQSQDPICSQVIKFCQSQWPQKSPEKINLVPYCGVRATLTVCNNLLLYNDRIVVPFSLQAATLQRLYEGHQGIQRCRTLARVLSPWPNISKEIQHMINDCQTFAKDITYHKEPLMLSALPNYP